MSNQNIQDVTSAGDRIKAALALVVVIAGIAGFYALSSQPMIARVGSVLGGLILGGLIGWYSGPGRRFMAFAQDSWKETRRVVWPTRKETTQMTLTVFGFVVVMALFLWVVDKSLEWLLYDLLLGWKK